MWQTIKKLLQQNPAGSDAPRSGASQQDKPAAEDCKKRGDGFLEQGNIDEAEQCYRQALAIDPEQAKACVGLGFIYSQRQLHAQAEAMLRQALSLAPDNADAHYLLGNLPQVQSTPEVARAHLERAITLAPGLEPAYLELCRTLVALGRAQEALQVTEAGIAANPASADLLFYLGNLQFGDKRFNDAIASYRRALASQPERVDILANLGLALLKNKAAAGAEQVLRQALSLAPYLPDLYANLGNALHVQGKLDDATAIYRQGLAIDANSALLNNNLGFSLQAQDRLGEAIACYEQALAADPDHADSRLNLGMALKAQGKIEEAMASFTDLLSREPDHAGAHVNCGNIYLETGRLDLAIVQYDLALRMEPNFHAYNNKGSALLMLGRFDEAVDCYERALDANPDLVAAYSSLLFTYNYMQSRSAPQMLHAARRFGDVVNRLATPFSDWPGHPEKNRRLRVGFVSGELRDGPVGFFAESVFAAWAADPGRRCDLVVYFHNRMHDAVSDRIKASCSEWHDVAALTDEQLAHRIHQDTIDILVDLDGHTAHNRLAVFAWKPAPVQATWLGYFATTGVAAIDYLVADPRTLPESEEIHFSEKIWRLPETRLCFTAPDLDIDVAPLPALQNGTVTFGCFNNLLKMNEATIALWARILAALPGSRLFLKAGALKDEATQLQTLERFAAHGIANERLILEGPQQRAAYLTAYHRVDIALDPFPYTGGATSAEALWMGVPIVTLAGERFLSRQGAGLLTNAGLPDWVANTQDEYVSIALRQAQDLQQLSQLRMRLRRQVLDSPLFDAPRFARHIDNAMAAMSIRRAGRET